MAVFLKDTRPKQVAIPHQGTVITVSSASNGTVRDVTVFGAKKSILCRPATFRDPLVKSLKSPVLLGPAKRPYSVPIKIETDYENSNANTVPTTTVILPTSKQKIPRPPNAFMLFAHDWRRQLAHQYPKESNKDISIRLGKMWKTLPKVDKERYFRSAREVDAEHKKKFPDYVYNPKEARMRKALREQSRGERHQVQGGGPPPRWVKQAYSMNHRQSLVSPIMLAQQQRRLDDNKATIREQVERDTGMLQNFPDYLDLSYPGLNIPSNPNEYSVFTDIDGQPWCPYLQTPMQSGTAYLMRNNEIKVPTSWSLSADYNSEQNNYMQPSPQESSYQHTNQQPQTDPLLLNGSHQPSEAETAAAALCLPLEPKVEHNLAINDETQPQVHMTEFRRTPEYRDDGSTNDYRAILPNNYLVSPASTNFMSSPSIWSSLLYCSPNKQTDPSVLLNSSNSCSQDAILPDFIDYGLLQASEFIPAQQESDQFSSLNFANQNFKQNEIDIKYEMDYSNFELNLDGTTGTSLSQNIIVPQILDSDNMFNTNDKPGFIETRSKNDCDNRFHNLMTSEEFAPQDLGRMSSLNRPPVIISQSDKICVVLESSGIDSDIKEFTSL